MCDTGCVLTTCYTGCSQTRVITDPDTSDYFKVSSVFRHAPLVTLMWYNSRLEMWLGVLFLGIVASSGSMLLEIYKI